MAEAANDGAEEVMRPAGRQRSVISDTAVENRLAAFNEILQDIDRNLMSCPHRRHR